MMASNILSRFLPSASDEPFETDALNNPSRRRLSSADEHGETDIDEENLEARFEAQDLENLLADASSSHMTTESTAFLPGNDRKPSTLAPGRAGAWRQPAPVRTAPLDDDDDVPESLLLEGIRDPPPPKSNHHSMPTDGLPPPVPGPSTRHTRAQWETTRRQQRLHDETHDAAPAPKWALPTRTGFTADPKEKAMWLWVNVEDLDAFLAEVYFYYTNCGIYSILLRGTLDLFQSAFIVGFLTFLGWCIDYPKISQSHKMSEVIVPQCTKKMHGFWVFALWLYILYFLYSSIQLVRAFPRLRLMHHFFEHLLDIPDRDIQTVEWQYIVSRIMNLRDANLTTASNISPETRKLLDKRGRQRLDAHDIASRLMRRENYLIALFNKEILDVTIPIPYLGNRFIFSKTTEWHVDLAIMDFVFGQGGKFDPDFLKEKNRRHLVKQLQKRLLVVGVISIAWAPFRVSYVLVSYLFKYFTEYHKDPSQLNTRDFTTFAQWKFREFNELQHLFERRRNMAYPYANLYLAQFPKNKTEQVSAFVAFVAGAFAFVLAVFTFLDSELFLTFEITPGKTALFWIGALSVIYRIARSSSPQEDEVAEPAYYLSHVIYHTHYEPEWWQERLHTDEVRAEFARLYQPKIVIFAEEVLSMFITPFLLIFRLPQSSERIVDFFREFSIVVDGLGVVCSYSMFPFKKGGDNAPANRAGRREDSDLREDYFMAKDNKMLASYYGFLDAYAGPGRGHYNARLQGRGSFHPPPQFPNNFGAMSVNVPVPETGGRGSSRVPAGRQPLPRRTPRQGPIPGRDEPINSILLDPHHQPTASTLRGSPRQTASSRYRTSLQPVSDPREPGLSRQNSSRIEEESTIGDSWRTSRLAQDDDEEEETTGNTRGGVLQLLQQFSKAQTEGRGAGVGM
ncbi:autophagy-related protein 9 [Lindgomyces ingoldianus]|uniref:Autophagy-related protein 9 n=1 Tax=Lindgomyces ingoldianus TaxID=673940 RepID=A0ACB6RFB9_9PLEO|nr:autophagy-related protein 9 [Lindgomyces ingoldianus]KAF2477988.1 autophagy-related protein 9 [Lindgomyces ingoldianus]